MSNDLVSRQAAIDIFDDYNIAVENGEIESYRRYREQLSNLPSVQPPKTGRWIPIKPLLTAARCSECKRAFTDRTIFCPNCGAKMKENENE